MGLPRSIYVRDGEVGVYHCFSRCVRRAFLCGVDATTGRDFSHRKAWVVDRLRFLATVFAIEVCAYAILATHFHSILRTRPDIVARWTDREVAIRWLILCPKHRDVASPPTEEEICALTDCPERIAILRRRLCSLSWFMGQLNEHIAREANKEDKVTGRFWEGRFKCQVLLDEAAIASCMVYVDLNLIRAGLAETPEESDFTSIQERIRAWQKEKETAPDSKEKTRNVQPAFSCSGRSVTEVSAEGPDPASLCIFTEADAVSPSDDWLCPIQTDSRRRGILQMTAAEYFDLVDRSGRMTRLGKRGAIDPDLAPILSRIGANPEEWLETVSRFGTRFCLAAGLLSNLRSFADQLGRRWLRGIKSARIAFCSPSPQGV